MRSRAVPDSELLGLAAKAAGYQYFSDEGAILQGCAKVPWNPLVVDGDALRLAVLLGIDLLFFSDDVEAIASLHQYAIDQEVISPWAYEHWKDLTQNPYAATRRAIVRAAAEIVFREAGRRS